MCRVDIYVSSASRTITAVEAYLMAKFQNAHLREDKLTGLKRSQFVSLTITKNLQGEVVPRAYMVSDQGMVLERSGMWSQSKDSFSCEIAGSISGKILPAVIRGSLQSTSHSHMLPGVSSTQKALKYFDPDLVLVHIPCGQVKLKLKETAAIAAHKYRSRQIFYHAKFPIENRFQFGEIQNDNAARRIFDPKLKSNYGAKSSRLSFFALYAKIIHHGSCSKCCKVSWATKFLG